MNKKSIFLVITLLIPILFFALLESALQLADYRGNLDMFESLKWQNKDYIKLNHRFSERYFFKLQLPPAPGNDIFLAKKPDSTLRFFVLGGSSTAGYPYGHNGMFSRLTRDMLLDANKIKDIEMVNVSMSAINTYTLYDQVREILNYEPDGILFYTGHNEYYGALGVGSVESLGVIPGFVRFFLRIQEFKTFLLVRDWVTKLVALTSSEDIDQSKTLMERVVKERFIVYGSPTYFAGLNQYRSNMSAMIEMLDEQEIPVWISTIGSNLRDHSPFESVTVDTLPKADEAYELAKSYLKSEQIDSATYYFELAKELDALRFRGPSAINDIVKALASEYENVRLVDANQALVNASEFGIPGKDLFLEHLHPNQKGNAIIGYEFGKAIASDPEFEGKFDPNLISNLSNYLTRMELSEFDHRIVYHRLRSLMGGWPFVKGPSKPHYKFDYTPQSLADSMAFEHVHGKLIWGKGKLQLAEKYLRLGDIESALEEYKGLIRDDPTNDSPLIFASRVLLDQNRFSEAYPMLTKAHKISPSDYTTKMIGILEITRGNAEKAIEMLEIMRRKTPSDQQVLYNLSGAYGVTKQYGKADEILFELEQINPRFPGIREWRAELDAALQRSSKN